MNRSLLIDSLKALLCGLIVLHHFCAYSPMADELALAWPALVDVLLVEGPLAVQPFLVIGGFLSAQALHRRATFAVVPLLVQRYLRLAPPLVLALLLVMGATVAVGHELADTDWLSPLPSWKVFLAHVLFLQDVLDVPSLSAGAWYVAIDLQLFGLLVLLAWACRRAGRILTDTWMPALVSLSAVASAFYFSRDEHLEMWAIHFFAAYGLGALTAWAAWSRRAWRWWWATVALMALDCLLDLRERPLWTLATAAALHAGMHLNGWHAQAQRGWSRVIQHLSDVSYSIFVCHYAVIILLSGLWMKYHLQGIGMAAAMLGGTLLVALAVGTAVHRVCERVWKLWPPEGIELHTERH